MKQHNWKYSLVLMLMLNTMSVMSIAQSTGNVKGKVIEQATKQPLVGVNVMLDNTQLGAVTDVDGVFTINNVPIGSYSLSISMVSFQTKKVIDIIVAVNKTYYAEFELLEDVSQLNEVTIVSFRGENNPL
ncbi:MAG TPA: carboxypeptidase-like regulatory domain-containing protein, partial [Cyclobacteriaceae bacterium]|nr:carboxypeptidase-like regulatory domain-containing protein [Cyclobacteriaceae bacterium]